MKPLTHHNVTRWLHRLPVIRAVNWDVAAGCLLCAAMFTAGLLIFAAMVSTCRPQEAIAHDLETELRTAKIADYIQSQPANISPPRANALASIFVQEAGPLAEYLACMVTVETGGTWLTTARSSEGAKGPFQLMPHARPARYDPRNWRQGARAAAKHLREKIQLTGSLHGGIRAYCGSGPEAREYLADVQREWWRGFGR